MTVQLYVQAYQRKKLQFPRLPCVYEEGAGTARHYYPIELVSLLPKMASSCAGCHRRELVSGTIFKSPS
jgi:hypothetical protein